MKLNKRNIIPDTDLGRVAILITFTVTILLVFMLLRDSTKVSSKFQELDIRFKDKYSKIDSMQNSLTKLLEESSKIMSIFNSSDTVHIKRATRYNPVKSQCDSDPLTTADNSKISLTDLERGRLRWCALSRDQLKRWGGSFNYGDTIIVVSESTPIVNGYWVIHDTMNKRYKNSLDFLLPTGAFSFGVIRDCKIINKF